MFNKFPTYEQILQDIKCGQHTGIPDCCILFFLSQWRQFSKKGIAVYWKIIDRASKRYGKYYGYIPCPTCLKKKPVPIYTCDCVIDEYWNNKANPGVCELCYKKSKSRSFLSLKSGNHCVKKMACKNCFKIKRQICQCLNPVKL